jgi:HSP20 family molecular chaperone IbpA
MWLKSKGLPAYRPLQDQVARPIFKQGRHCGANKSGQSLNKDASMTKLTLSSHPFLLGFEQLERLVERTAKADLGGYPPFNIEQTTPESFRITLAVAGFAEDDLSITVEDRQLMVRGKQTDDNSGRVFLHQGIAARQFHRSFVMADGVEVAGASMENGLLHIDLKHLQPETVIRTITISSGK